MTRSPTASAVHTLAQFQDDFVQALYGAGTVSTPLATLSSHFVETPQAMDAASSMAKLSAQPGFSVYRNTVIKGCVDALQANYPTVAQLVGAAWFRSAASVYVRETPPTRVSMLEYGADFAVFLARFAPARELPYLSDVARLDRLWTEAHVAADQPPITPDALARLCADQLGGVVLRPHPAARWTWFAAHPAYTIWRANREQQALDDELAWVAEGALLTRPQAGVIWQAATQGSCAFLDACAAGLPLVQAAQCALEAQPSQDVAQLLADLISAGALSADAPVQSY